MRNYATELNTEMGFVHFHFKRDENYKYKVVGVHTSFFGAAPTPDLGAAFLAIENSKLFDELVGGESSEN
jgi:hypothetical protein